MWRRRQLFFALSDVEFRVDERFLNFEQTHFLRTVKGVDFVKYNILRRKFSRSAKQINNRTYIILYIYIRPPTLHFSAVTSILRTSNKLMVVCIARFFFFFLSFRALLSRVRTLCSPNGSLRTREAEWELSSTQVSCLNLLFYTRERVP